MTSSYSKRRGNDRMRPGWIRETSDAPKRHPQQRMCECGSRLSQYNPDDACHTCRSVKVWPKMKEAQRREWGKL